MNDCFKGFVLAISINNDENTVAFLQYYYTVVSDNINLLYRNLNVKKLMLRQLVGQDLDTT